MAGTPKTWDVENQQFWESTGKKIANRNLWASIPNLLCGFSVWLYWGMIAKIIRRIHAGNPELFDFTFGNDGQPYGDDLAGYAAMLLTLPAVAGLVGATLRIPNSFMIAICGGRNVKFMTTVLLIVPAVGAGIALQNPKTPFSVLVVLAAMSGVGGGAFASSMSNISFFFPKKVQGLALGLNAGLGNAGVSIMQFLIPWVITFGLFGSLGGDPQQFQSAGAESPPTQLWIQNAALVWVPIMTVLAVLAWVVMNNLPQHKCGSAPVAIGKYLWLTLLGFGGGTIGVLMLISDWGGFPELVKIFITLAVTVIVTLAFMRFLTPTETRNNRMIPIIFSKEQAGPVLGWTSAIAAYGAYLIPKIFATQIKAGTPEYALYGFAVYYASCLLVNWWFYARANAEIKC
jgi:NNP family nitrate/nitrite transporter-like MFS transporter